MTNILYAIIALFATFFLAVITYAFISRYLAIRKYGIIPKPDLLNKIDKKMSIDELLEVFGDDLVEQEVPKTEMVCPDHKRYTWRHEISNRGAWIFTLNCGRDIDWPTLFSKKKIEYVHWSIIYESYESKALNFGLGGVCRP